MARPSSDPDWAENVVNDPTSGQDNRVEPPASWKNNGWSYQEKPPRNYDNWVKWNLGQWVKYLDDVTARTATYVVAASDATDSMKELADAECDGTDDHVQISAAIDAIATTGGTVVLTEGTFTVDAAVAMDQVGVHLRGMGRESTVILVDPATSSDFSAIQVTADDTSISDLTVDGNKASVAQNSVGIKLQSGSRCSVERCSVKDVSANPTSGVGIQVASDVVWISGCYVSGCEGVGIEIQSGADQVSVSGCKAVSSGTNGFFVAANGVSLDSCVSDSSTVDGFDVSGSGVTLSCCQSTSNSQKGFDINGDGNTLSACNSSSNSSNHGFSLDGDKNSMSGCRSDGDQTGVSVSGAHNSVVACPIHGALNAGARLTGATQSSLVGCTISGCGLEGVVFEGASADCRLSECVIEGNSQTLGASYNGIDLAGTTDECTVCNNTVREGAGANKHDYAIGGSAISSANSNYIYGNDFVNGGTTGIIEPGSQAKTIPEWVGSAAGTNVQDTIANANRTA